METSSGLPVNILPADISSSLYVCLYCGKSFTRRSYLSCHMAAHRSPALECDACHRQFGRVDSLRRHRCPALNYTDDSSERIHRRHCCPSCEKTYSRRATLLRHVVQHHQELLSDIDGQQKSIEAHPCSVCHHVFVSAVSLHNHKVVIHGGASLVDSCGLLCNSCGCQFASPMDVNRHLCPSASQQHDDVEETEMSLQQPTASETPSDSHIDDETISLQQSSDETEAEKTCMCQFCGRTFSSSGWLRRHVNGAHRQQSCSDGVSQSQASAKQQHVCSVCGKSLSSVGNLNKHLLTHGARHEACPECGRQFHQRATLRQHIRHVHAPPGSFAVECPTCGLRMRSRNSLYAHIARFHPPSYQQPHHICHICGRTFHQRGNLRRHERTHSDEAVYVCRDCPRRLRSAERLKRHKTWHEQGAQFACADCGRRFVQPSDLRRHIAFRHSSNSKTYRCCYCGVCCRHYQVCSFLTLVDIVLDCKVFSSETRLTTNLI